MPLTYQDNVKLALASVVATMLAMNKGTQGYVAKMFNLQNETYVFLICALLAFLLTLVFNYFLAEYKYALNGQSVKNTPF